ncbi:MAG: V-type ATP synthase subunit A [Promethearchaeia archaeon]
MTESDSNIRKESHLKEDIGYLSAINGSLVEVKGFQEEIRLYDLVKIKRFNIIGEVLQIHPDRVVAQCFESTNKLKLNEKVINLKEPLSMELGPGLLGNVFDGIQRPLKEIYLETSKSGFLKRGVELNSLPRNKKWHFIPTKEVCEEVRGGDVIGIVQETPVIKHKIMIPMGESGKLSFIVPEGNYCLLDTIYKIQEKEKEKEKEKAFNMLQKCPVTEKRKYRSKLRPGEPLITGIRVIDLLFPIVKGGTVGVPGGFGTGKTVIQHSLAKWCNADIIVFIGCGERGNEIADLLDEFSHLNDPNTSRPLLERIVLIANTSNMPVSAREASIFSGMTIAEYYRDMGYDVAVLADSTSRWAEALRELSGLLEEMPAEEGYPSYLPSKLSGFYERAGKVKTIGEDEANESKSGSISIIGSISPPSNDFSEPVTATTKRFVQAFWALDASLAYSKHYPAINWLESYSNYPNYIADWYFERDIDWHEIDLDWLGAQGLVNEILSEENNLRNLTQLMGEDNLPEYKQFLLFISRLIKDGFLIQNAFDDVDCFTTTKKLLGQIKLILLLFNEGKKLLEKGILLEDIKSLSSVSDILRISQSIPNDDFSQILKIKDQLINELETLKISYEVE